MPEPRAQVRNAADPKQVKRAERKAREREALFQDALKAILATSAGRVVLWELLARARVFESIWHPSAEIHYLAGRQDYGHELMAMLVDADDELFFLMQQEARARAKRDDRATDAAHTAGAEESIDG